MDDVIHNLHSLHMYATVQISYKLQNIVYQFFLHVIVVILMQYL